MKKILLLSSMALAAFVGHAQKKSVVSNNVTRLSQAEAPGMMKKHVRADQVFDIVEIDGKKYRATPFATDDLGSGSANSLPTGWTAGGSVAQTWVWKNSAFTGGVNIGTIASTTASNGWLGYDSRGIAGANPTSNSFNGWVQKTFNCTGHNTVMLSFQTKFRRYVDSCYIQVSTNGGSTWTSYSISELNSLANTTSSANPEKIDVNITSAAANAPAAIVRFFYQCNIPQGSYNWLVDDITLSELDPVDIAIKGGYVWCVPTDPNIDVFTFSALPESMKDSIITIIGMDNKGINSLTNIVTNVKVEGPGGNIGNTTITHASMPSWTKDSFKIARDLQYPNLQGVYTVTYQANVTGDAVTTNNVDTAYFVISDSVYSRNDGEVSGGYILYNKASGGSPARAFSMGTLFDLPFGDTITQARVAFASITQPGAKVAVGLYKFDPTTSTWSLKHATTQKSLVAAEISTQTNLRFATFNFPTTLDCYLEPGSYALVAEAQENTPTSPNAIVLATANMNRFEIFGVSDTNDVVYGFGATGLPSGLPTTPIVQAIFGHLNPPLPIEELDLNGNTIIAHPNPAQDQISVKVTATESSTGNTLKITNSLGQEVMAIPFGELKSGMVTSIKVDISSLPAGNYIISIPGSKHSYSKTFMKN